MFIVTDTKMYIALALFWGIVVYILKKDLTVSIFYELLLFLPFERVIRGWVFTPVPAGPEYWQDGFSYILGISVKFIAGIALFLFLAFEKKRYLVLKHSLITWILLLLFLLAFAGTMTAARLDLSLTGLIRLWLSLFIFLASVVFFKDSGINKQFMPYLLCVLCMNGIIGSLQYILQHPLGLNMEDISWNLPNGFLTSDLDQLFRVSGFMGHPTFFGSFTSMLLPLGMIATIISFKKLKQQPVIFLISLVALIFGTVSIIGTLSRSAWLSVCITFIILAWNALPTMRANLVKNYRYILFFSGALFVFVFFFGIIFSDRIKTIQYVWQTGSGAGRLELMDHAFQMIRTHPFFGVGLNHFTAEMIDQGVKPEFRGFIYPVHNTFLLMFSELGIPATTLFIFFIGIILYKSWITIKISKYNLGIWLGAIAFIINAQFHTLFLDPSFDLFMVILGYLSAQL